MPRGKKNPEDENPEEENDLNKKGSKKPAKKKSAKKVPALPTGEVEPDAKEEHKAVEVRSESKNPQKDAKYVMHCQMEDCDCVEFFARHDGALQCSSGMCGAIYRWSNTMRDWILSDELPDKDRKKRYRMQRAETKMDEDFFGDDDFPDIEEEED